MPFFDEYPYTNFHNVNLDWILQRVKEWGELVEQNNTAFHNLEEANENFKEYVTNYLQNLDVQDEINIKMDALLESGVLISYMQPYISTGVTTWLDTHITQPTTPIIDTSLTVAGAGADAKVTGERLTVIESEIDNVINNAFSDEAKNALLNVISHIGAWTDSNALTYYNTLREALFNEIHETWTAIWNFTDGLPNVIDGFELQRGNNQNDITLTNNGLLMSVANVTDNTARIRYLGESNGHLFRKATTEVVFCINSYGKAISTSYGWGVRDYAGLGYNSNNTPTSFVGGQIVFSGNGVKFRNAIPAWEIIQDIIPLNTGIFYKIRLEVDRSTTKIYIDDVLKANLSNSNMIENVSFCSFTVTEDVSATIRSYKIRLED